MRPYTVKKRYKTVRFSAVTIRTAISTYDSVTPKQLKSEPNVTMKVTEDGEQWSCPTLEAFLLAYGRADEASYFRTSYFDGYGDSIFSITFLSGGTHVQIEAPDESQIGAVLNVFETDRAEIGDAVDNSPAGIEYAGIPGATEECKNAVVRLLQFGDQIVRARILSCSDAHCLLLTVNVGDLIAVKSGFGSGYSGEGPHGFSFVLQLLEAHKVKVEEYVVDEDLIERLDTSSLTRGDIKKLDAAKPVRPTRWYDYVFDRDEEHRERGTLWQDFPAVIPWATIDPRITDLAGAFFQHPNQSLLFGYARLEDVVRGRTGIEDHGQGLFSKAFLSDSAQLTWKGASANEVKGRGLLFTGAFLAYRNPRAHSEMEHDISSLLIEFLLLNHLFVLEAAAGDRSVP